MKQHKWLCTNCNRTGVSACFELSDMTHLPDVTIGPAHHAVSPDCATPKILFAIEGQIFEWARRRSTETGTSPTYTEASRPTYVLPEVVLLLIELYAQKVVIIESRTLPPESRAQALKNAIAATRKAEEIRVEAGVPHRLGKFSLRVIMQSVKNRKRVMIFVGRKGSWKKWQYMLKKRRKFSLLRQSIRFDS